MITVLSARHRFATARPGASQRGFTLIEIVVVVAILLILAAVALPAYTSQVMRGNRAAAQTVMMDMASKQEQYLLVNRSYGDSAALLGSTYALPRELVTKYDFTIVPGMSPEPTFLITFTPKGPQTGDVTLTLNNAGVKTPADKW
jgi:type IV pilus assembly protein PilE